MSFSFSFFFLHFFETDKKKKYNRCQYYKSYWPLKYFIILYIWRISSYFGAFLIKVKHWRRKSVADFFQFWKLFPLTFELWRLLLASSLSLLPLVLFYDIMQKSHSPKLVRDVTSNQGHFHVNCVRFVKWVQNQNIQAWHYCDTLMTEVYLGREHWSYSYIKFISYVFLFKQSLTPWNYCPLLCKHFQINRLILILKIWLF